MISLLCSKVHPLSSQTSVIVDKQLVSREVQLHVKLLNVHWQ